MCECGGNKNWLWLHEEGRGRSWLPFASLVNVKTKIFHGNAWNELKIQFFALSPAPSTSHFQAVSFPYRAETIRSRDWSICKSCQMTSPRLSSLCEKGTKITRKGMVGSLNADLRFHHLLSKSHHSQHREYPGKRDMVWRQDNRWVHLGRPLADTWLRGCSKGEYGNRLRIKCSVTVEQVLNGCCKACHG